MDVVGFLLCCPETQLGNRLCGAFGWDYLWFGGRYGFEERWIYEDDERWSIQVVKY